MDPQLRAFDEYPSRREPRGAGGDVRSDPWKRLRAFEATTVDQAPLLRRSLVKARTCAVGRCGRHNGTRVKVVTINGERGCGDASGAEPGGALLSLLGRRNRLLRTAAAAWEARADVR